MSAMQLLRIVMRVVGVVIMTAAMCIILEGSAATSIEVGCNASSTLASLQLFTRSNTTYILRDCVAQVHFAMSPPPAILEQTTFLVEGGSMVPYINLTGVGNITNLYVSIRRVQMSSDVLPSGQPLLLIPPASSTTVRVVQNLTVTIEDAVLAFRLNNGSTGTGDQKQMDAAWQGKEVPLLVGIAASSLMSITINATNTTINVTSLLLPNGGSAVFLVYAIQQATSVGINVRNCTLLLDSQASHARWLGLRLSVSRSVVVSFDEDTTVMTRVRTVPSESPSADTDLTVVQFEVDTTCVDVTMTCRRTSLRLYFYGGSASDVLGLGVVLFRMVSQNFLRPRIREIYNATVSITDVDFNAHGNFMASMIVLQHIYLMQNVAVHVANCRATLAADGLLLFNFANRISAVLFIQNMSLTHSTITVENMTASSYMLSGNTPASKMSNVAADIVDIDAGLLDATIHVVNCSMFADLRNGSLSTLSLLSTELSLFAASTSVVRLYKTRASSQVDISVKNSIVTAHLGFSLNPNAVLTFATSAITLVCVLANCSSCTVSIVDSIATTVSMQFPVVTMNNPFSQVNQMNLTLVFTSMDLGGFLAKAGISSAGIPDPGMQAMSSPIAMNNMNISIINSTARHPLPPLVMLSSSVADGAASSGLVSMMPRPGDVLSFVALPRYMTQSAIFIQAAASLSSSSQLYSPLHAVACAFDCTAVDMNITVEGAASTTRANVQQFASLAAVGQSLFELQNTHLSYSRIQLLWPKWQYASFLPEGGTALHLGGWPGTRPRIALDSLSRMDVWNLQGVNFGKHFMPATSNITWNSDHGAGAAAAWPTVSRITLLRVTCVLWNGAPLNETLVMERVPQQYVWWNNESINPCWETPAPVLSVYRRPWPSSLARAIFAASSATLTWSMVAASSVGGGVSGGLGSSSRLQMIANAARMRARCEASGGDFDDVPEPPSSSILDNPLQIHVDALGPVAAYSGGAVIGNLVLVFVTGLIIHGCRQLRRFGETGRRAFPLLKRVLMEFIPEVESLPGSVVFLYSIVLQPIATASVVLLVSTSPAGLVEGACSLVLAVTLPMAIATGAVLRPPFPLAFAPIVSTTKPRASSSSSTSTSILRRFKDQQLLVPPGRWIAKQQASKGGIEKRASSSSRDSIITQQRARFLLDRLAPLFSGYRGGMHWYFLVELGMGGVVAGLVSGAALAVPAASACVAAQWAGLSLVIIAGLQFLLHVALRPLAVPLDRYLATSCASMAFVAQVLSLFDGFDNAVNVLSIVVTMVSFAGVLVGCVEGLTRWWKQRARGNDVRYPSAAVGGRSRMVSTSVATELQKLVMMACETGRRKSAERRGQQAK